MFLATGHEGLGITTSLASARFLVDQLIKRPSEIPVEPYLPAREAEISMPDSVDIEGEWRMRCSCRSGATVAVAMTIAHAAFRRSVSGEPRGPLCGMGICFECRVAIDGIPHCRSCQILCGREWT